MFNHDPLHSIYEFLGGFSTLLMDLCVYLFRSGDQVSLVSFSSHSFSLLQQSSSML